MDFCCDLHGLHCEPPSELCCENCTEAHHGPHICEGVPRHSHHDFSSCVLDVKKSERNAEPEWKWLQVWREYQWAGDFDLDDWARYTHFLNAFGLLYVLLEPASVRERRLNNG